MIFDMKPGRATLPTNSDAINCLFRTAIEENGTATTVGGFSLIVANHLAKHAFELGIVADFAQHLFKLLPRLSD